MNGCKHRPKFLLFGFLYRKFSNRTYHKRIPLCKNCGKAIMPVHLTAQYYSFSVFYLLALCLTQFFVGIYIINGFYELQPIIKLLINLGLFISVFFITALIFSVLNVFVFKWEEYNPTAVQTPIFFGSNNDSEPKPAKKSNSINDRGLQ